MKIGVIGLGNMGNPMVQRFIQFNHQVYIYDISPTAIQRLATSGAQVQSSYKELALNADYIVLSLQTSAQVKSVCLEKDGLFSFMQPGSMLIDCSSLDIDTSLLIHQAAKDRDICMLDAPVSGGPGGTLGGILTIMVGGEEAHYQRALPILQCIGKNIVHVGKAGNGCATKICNNLMLGTAMVGVSEAFVLAEHLGLSAEKLFEISSNASGQSFALTRNVPIAGLTPNAAANNNFAAKFSARMMLKDLQHGQMAAQASGAATPLSAEAMSLFSLFVNLGYGELDFSGIYKMIHGQRG